MYIVAVTGGIGAGKSTAARFFQSFGAAVIDLDDVARRLMQPGTVVFDEVIETFGESILADDGYINRTMLAEKAFVDAEAAQVLNGIVHPAVARDVMPGLTDMGLLQNPPSVVVLVIPMLVEAPVFAEVADVILTIEATEGMRVRRAIDRGMEEDDVRARIMCQATPEQRIGLADKVVVNEGTLDDLESELQHFWDEVVTCAS